MTLLAVLILTGVAWGEWAGARWLLTAMYLCVLGVVSVYGLHRYWLVWLYYRNVDRPVAPQSRFEELPVVTVQLPMFNEESVAERAIDAACRLDWPRDRLQVLVLDDSTDGSTGVCRRRVAYWAGRGYDVELIHRSERRGFKAGALAGAMAQTKGKIIAIFDADFVPERDFLRRTVDYFTDPGVGMVQTRWEHLNRDDSLLTRSQAIFLDAHFVIEHTARNRSGRWINFNGTAGLWRREAIETAGGWQHDTLTEDVDLSYRAQLAGWRFVFLPGVTCPAELPPEINAFKSQQHRWTKGSIQTARKLLPRLMRAGVPVVVKVEAFFHLTSPMCYLYLTLMALLFYPAIFVNMQVVERGSWVGVLLGVSLFAMGTVSASAFYVASQRARGGGVWGTVAQLPVLMGIGIGIAINNARGCLEAMAGQESPFVRTPKYNSGGGGGKAGHGAMVVLATPSIKLWMSLLEVGMGLYMVECVRMAVAYDHHTFISVPSLLVFAAGYFYVGLSSLWSQIQTRRVAGVRRSLVIAADERG